MSNRSLTDLSKVNLQRFFILRNIAIGGQLLSVLFVHYYLNIKLPLLLLFYVVVIEIAFNVWTKRLTYQLMSSATRQYFLQVLFDIGTLTALLYLSGGASNPFTALYLIPLAISATVLSSKETWLLAVISVVCYSVLVWVNVPLPMPHEHGDGFGLHVIGMWVGFILSAGLLAYFVVGMGTTLREQEKQLVTAHEKALKNDQLVALGTQAAGTAHELGTPLNTMTIIIEEIEALLPDAADEVYENLDTLSAQIAHCKTQLSELLTRAGSAQASGGKPLDIEEFIECFVSQWQDRHAEATLVVNVSNNNTPPIVVIDHRLTQALFNILDNAAKVSPQSIELAFSWDDEQLRFEVADRGPGLPEGMLGVVGKKPISDKMSGHGIGLYLTYAVVEQFSGKVTIKARQGGGTVVVVQVPLDAYRID
jgi:two-component system, sensor histidine kinase RegB